MSRSYWLPEIVKKAGLSRGFAWFWVMLKKAK